MKKLSLFGNGSSNKPVLRETGGGGGGISLFGKGGSSTAVSPQGKESAFSRMQEATKKPNDMLALFGLDYTASTLSVIQKFRESVFAIVNALKEEFSEPNIYFGKYDGSQNHEISKKEDTQFLIRENVVGNSNVPKFLNLIKERNILEESKNANVFLLGDELCLSEKDFSPEELSAGIAYLKEKNANLFFLYEETVNDGISKEYLIENLIKPLGEKGMLLDFSNVDINKLMDIIKACTIYTVKNNVSKATGGKKISLKDHLKNLGIGNGNLQLTQGSDKSGRLNS